MNEVQSVIGLFVIGKGEKIIFKKFSNEFKEDKADLELKVSQTMEECVFEKEMAFETQVLSLESHILTYKILKDFTIVIVSDRYSENQLFISNSLDALFDAMVEVTFIILWFLGNTGDKYLT